MSGAADKRALRILACELRSALGPEARTAASAVVADHVATLPELEGARLVLGYAAVGDELDPGPALARLAARGARIVYPRVETAGELSLRLARPEELSPGAYGIPEPPLDAEKVETSRIDAAVVPGVAFDPRCARLGHGEGYYDRLLTSLRAGAVVVGVAFDEQVLDDVPMEAHDVPMDILVTPSLLVRRG